MCRPCTLLIARRFQSGSMHIDQLITRRFSGLELLSGRQGLARLGLGCLEHAVLYNGAIDNTLLITRSLGLDSVILITLAQRRDISTFKVQARCLIDTCEGQSSMQGRLSSDWCNPGNRFPLVSRLHYMLHYKESHGLHFQGITWILKRGLETLSSGGGCFADRGSRGGYSGRF